MQQLEKDTINHLGAIPIEQDFGEELEILSYNGHRIIENLLYV